MNYFKAGDNVILSFQGWTQEWKLTQEEAAAGIVCLVVSPPLRPLPYPEEYSPSAIPVSCEPKRIPSVEIVKVIFAPSRSKFWVWEPI